MPLQNRVAPDGTIYADRARGLLMGNRGGQLHGADKQLMARRWASKQWIACALEYKGRRETIMAPGRYTQLFFLDEVTALAAGHRPCALCRRADFLRFMEGWQQLHGFTRLPKVAEVDAVLHPERVGSGKRKVTFGARLGDLPDGVMVAAGHDEMGGAHLHLSGTLLPWSPSGYGPPVESSPRQAVSVLTPRSIVAVVAAGYQPRLHPSARSRSAAKSA